jgi:hypothetical protein
VDVEEAQMVNVLGWHDLSEEEYLEKLKEYEKNQKAEG